MYLCVSITDISIYAYIHIKNNNIGFGPTAINLLLAPKPVPSLSNVLLR